MFINFITVKVDIDCDSPFDDEVTFPGTTIISPNYPTNYGVNKDCQMKIRFAEGQRVVIRFLDFEIWQCNVIYAVIIFLPLSLTK